MKEQRYTACLVHSFLISAIGGEMSASRPRLLDSRENSPGYLIIGESGGPHSRCRRLRIQCNVNPLPGIEPCYFGRPSPYPSPYTTEQTRLHLFSKQNLSGRVHLFLNMSRCCWNRARRLTCSLSASVTKKGLQFGIWIGPSFRHYRFRPTTSGSRSG
jgi:hypothetical protein